MTRKILPIRTARYGLHLAACWLLSACVSASQMPQPAGTDPASGAANGYQDLELVARLPPPEYTRQGTDVPIAENDLLEIDVFQVDELDKTVRVDARGRISLPLVGIVQAAGKTARELASAIERKYGGRYVQDPQVTVFVKESAGQRVTVDGAVKKPGIYPVISDSTLLQVIAQAGGFKEIADESRLYVFRRFGDRELAANYDVKDIRSGRRRDPHIYGGDVLVAFPSRSKVAVKNLREALVMASRVGVFVP